MSRPRRRPAPHVRLALLVPAALAVAAACGAPARAPEPAASARVPMAVAREVAFVEVTLDGEPLLALVDTGATASAIDARRADGLPSLGATRVLGTTGDLAADLVEVAGLRLGDVALPTLRATSRDLSAYRTAGGDTLDLILGSDALAGRAVVLDFDAGALELRPGGGTEAGAPMPLDDHGVPTLDASLGGLDVRLRIDTGASLFDTPDVHVNVPARVAEELDARGVPLEPAGHLLATGLDGRPVELALLRIDDVRIASVALPSAYLIVQPEQGYFALPDAVGFVGNNFLRRLGRVTLDYGAERLRAEGTGSGG